MRSDGRLAEQLRPTRITPNYLIHAEGSVLVEAGKTKVICTASVEDRVPPFRRNTGKGWVTAEYGMLPRATTTRSQREASAGKVGGRTQEIQRLIGRSLRTVTRLEEIGERTITLDCDVIQADGGTRTASITGAFVALVLAMQKLREQDVLRTMPITDFVAATSVGIVEGEPMLDLAYTEDSRADVDMNVVKTGRRPLHRAAGDGGSTAVRPRGAEPAARSGRHRHAPADRAAARARRSVSRKAEGLSACPERAQRVEGAAARRHHQHRETAGNPVTARWRPGRARDTARSRTDRGARGNRAHLRGQRPAEGTLLLRARRHDDRR